MLFKFGVLQIFEIYPIISVIPDFFFNYVHVMTYESKKSIISVFCNRCLLFIRKKNKE